MPILFSNNLCHFCRGLDKCALIKVEKLNATIRAIHEENKGKLDLKRKMIIISRIWKKREKHTTQNTWNQASPQKEAFFYKLKQSAKMPDNWKLVETRYRNQMKTPCLCWNEYWSWPDPTEMTCQLRMENTINATNKLKRSCHIRRSLATKVNFHRRHDFSPRICILDADQQMDLLTMSAEGLAESSTWRRNSCMRNLYDQWNIEYDGRWTPMEKQ